MKFTDRHSAHDFYRLILDEAKAEGTIKSAMAELGLKDLFFLLVYLLNRKDLDRDWLFERCKEVQSSPNGHLDLWAREHYKSTIVTFGLTIQDMLNDPDITIGIFSFNRPIAKTFLRQIKTEFENNALLFQLYPDVVWQNPKKEASKWSEDDGLVLKRSSNPKESTLEAWGLVDAMPVSRHFKIRLYDDVITERNVTSPDMIKKATQAWELSLNLGSTQSTKRYDEIDIERYVGTRYHFNDTYAEIMKRGAAKKRIHPGTHDGKPEGKPVLWDEEFIREKRRKLGPYIFGCQILQNPKADEAQGFLKEWLRFWKVKQWNDLNRYLLCDPAGEKKKDNDFTVMLVIGLGVDRNYYLIDGIRDRLNLTERTQQLFKFHRMYRPLATGYEKYGKDSDIEHIQDKMELENYRFEITPLGGATPKNDRIRKLIPIFDAGRWFLPEYLYFVDRDKKQRDLVRELIDDEYFPFPVGTHDDILDCAARIRDEKLMAEFPMADEEPEELPDLDDLSELPGYGGMLGAM
ncbi:MAG: hypothetical protein HKM93_08870 [Desulfobacteraceae bacterium]|nr:hypothetical protein [Desulfobacteraceae bacterium]